MDSHQNKLGWWVMLWLSIVVILLQSCSSGGSNSSSSGSSSYKFCNQQGVVCYNFSNGYTNAQIQQIKSQLASGDIVYIAFVNPGEKPVPDRQQSAVMYSIAAVQQKNQLPAAIVFSQSEPAINIYMFGYLPNDIQLAKHVLAPYKQAANMAMALKSSSIPFTVAFRQVTIQNNFESNLFESSSSYTSNSFINSLISSIPATANVIEFSYEYSIDMYRSIATSEGGQNSKVVDIELISASIGNSESDIAQWKSTVSYGTDSCPTNGNVFSSEWDGCGVFGYAPFLNSTTITTNLIGDEVIANHTTLTYRPLTTTAGDTGVSTSTGISMGLTLATSPSASLTWSDSISVSQSYNEINIASTPSMGNNNYQLITQFYSNIQDTSYLSDYAQNAGETYWIAVTNDGLGSSWAPYYNTSTTSSSGLNALTELHGVYTPEFDANYQESADIENGAAQLQIELNSQYAMLGSSAYGEFLELNVINWGVSATGYWNGYTSAPYINGTPVNVVNTVDIDFDNIVFSYMTPYYIKLNNGADVCLTAGNPVYFAQCNKENINQIWGFNLDTNTFYWQPTAGIQRCLSFNSTTKLFTLSSTNDCSTTPVVLNNTSSNEYTLTVQNSYYLANTGTYAYGASSSSNAAGLLFEMVDTRSNGVPINTANRTSINGGFYYSQNDNGLAKLYGCTSSSDCSGVSIASMSLSAESPLLAANSSGNLYAAFESTNNSSFSIAEYNNGTLSSTPSNSYSNSSNNPASLLTLDLSSGAPSVVFLDKDKNILNQYYYSFSYAYNGWIDSSQMTVVSGSTYFAVKSTQNSVIIIAKCSNGVSSCTFTGSSDGTSSSVGYSVYPSLMSSDNSGNLYLAYFDYANSNSLKVVKYSNANLNSSSQLGSSISITNPGQILALPIVNSTPYIVYTANNQLMIESYNGTSWQ